jgi:formylglycine-generating enzyme required for sulfatase activity
MGKYEVTQAEYKKHCSYGIISPSSSKGYGDNYPAYIVSWYDALVYCNKRSMEEGLTPCYSIDGSTDPEHWGAVPIKWDDPLRDTWDVATCNWNANGYRLPTEAEWEYAARAGDNTVDSSTYSGTSDVNKLGEYAWYKDNSNSATHEVGTKLPNAFGLFDMSGNVMEWCWNWYTDSYDTTTEGGSDPTGASDGSSRVLRGGGFNNLSSGCAVSYRSYDSPSWHPEYLGFRVVRNAN